jgi:hypothetical protein
MERSTEALACVPKAHSPEPSTAGAVRKGGLPRRDQGASPEKGRRHEEHPPKPPGGRPHKRWRIKVVRIDAEKYPEFARDKDHPFARMAVEARIEEFDSFFARLRARGKAVKSESGGLLAAA